MGGSPLLGPSRTSRDVRFCAAVGGIADIERARSPPRARKIAMPIANSPLVKTAIAGEDANWGRVVMAVGKAGEPADRDKLAIWFNGIRVAHKGARDGAYDE